MARLIDAAYAANWTSAAGALTGVLLALGSHQSEAEIGARSGHAFRFAVTETMDGLLGASGPNHFPAATALPLYETLGWRFSAVEVAATAADFERQRQDAVVRLRKTLDRGRPALVYGLKVEEFGVLRGYDHDTWFASTLVNGENDQRIPIADWPAQGRSLSLRAYLPEQKVNVDQRQALARLLQFVVTEAKAGESVVLGKRAVTGLAGYRRWLAAVEGDEPISPGGQARCLQALQAARKDAATFLRGVAKDAVGGRSAAKNADNGPALAAAATAYIAEVVALAQLITLFPFPNGGDPNSPTNRRLALPALRRVLTAEEQAIATLAQVVSAR